MGIRVLFKGIKWATGWPLNVLEDDLNANAITIKGAPGLECRMYTRLFSPAIGHEKKNGTPYFLIKLDIWSSIKHCTTYHQQALSY